LESWKEIAVYFKRSERTVRRWEEKEGLPVHRLRHDKRGSVYAFRWELEGWRESRQQLMAVEAEPEGIGFWSKRLSWAAAIVALAVCSGGAYWMLRRPHGTPEYTPNPEAYRAFQRAYFGGNVGRTQVLSGIKNYQEAVRLDPRFARAWVGLANAHLASLWWGESSPRDILPQAKMEAQKALALDGSLGGPWRVLALASHYLDWDHATAEKQFRRALELSPRDAVAASWFAEFLLNRRRYDEALVFAKQAQDIDPRWLEPVTVAGNIHLFSGNPDLAIVEYRRALEVEPGHGLTNHFLGRAYLAKGQTAQAIQQLRRSNELLGEVPFSLADLGYALASSGQRQEAEQMLSGLIRKRDTGYYPAFAIAEIQLGLGDLEAAVLWLERASDERQVGFYFPSADPVYDPLRAHPRFQALVRRMHLEL
jgi:serine/threonine-protein kinase